MSKVIKNLDRPLDEVPYPLIRIPVTIVLSLLVFVIMLLVSIGVSIFACLFFTVREFTIPCVKGKKPGT